MPPQNLQPTACSDVDGTRAWHGNSDELILLNVKRRAAKAALLFDSAFCYF
jgi:hypothetical protein